MNMKQADVAQTSRTCNGRTQNGFTKTIVEVKKWPEHLEAGKGLENINSL